MIAARCFQFQIKMLYSFLEWFFIIGWLKAVHYVKFEVFSRVFRVVCHVMLIVKSDLISLEFTVV